MADKVRPRIVQVQWTERPLTPDELARARLLDIDDVVERTRFCRAQIYRMMDAGLFPRPLKFSPGRRGAVRWPDIWISEWIGLALRSVFDLGSEPSKQAVLCEEGS